MDIMDKPPCFEPDHKRNAVLCLDCERPTPLFPEWIGKTDSLRADLEKTRGELEKANIDGKNIYDLWFEANENCIRLDGELREEKEKLSAQAKEIAELKEDQSFLKDQLRGIRDSRGLPLFDVAPIVAYFKKRDTREFLLKQEITALTAHNAESMGINTELAADNAKLRERVKELRKDVGCPCMCDLAWCEHDERVAWQETQEKNKSLQEENSALREDFNRELDKIKATYPVFDMGLQEENSALLAQNGELRDALQGLQWPEKGWDSMAALDLAERRGREALSRTPQQSLADLRAGVREEEWEAFEGLASGGVAQGFTMVRFLQSIKDARTRAAKAKSLTEKP